MEKEEAIEFVKRVARLPKDQELVEKDGTPTGRDEYDYHVVPASLRVFDRDNDTTSELLHVLIQEARELIEADE